MGKIIIIVSCILFLAGCNTTSSPSSTKDINIVKISNTVLDTNDTDFTNNSSSNSNQNILPQIVSEIDDNIVTSVDTTIIKNRLTFTSGYSSPKCIKIDEPMNYLNITFSIDKNIQIDKSSLNLGVMVEPISKDMLLKVVVTDISIYSENKRLNINTDNSNLIIYGEDTDDNIYSLSQHISNIATITQDINNYNINFNISIDSNIASQLTFNYEKDFVIFFGLKERNYNLEFINFELMDMGDVLGVDLSNSYGFSKKFSVSQNCN